MEDFLLNILGFVATVPVGIILLLIFLIGMYVFWRGCKETEKDRSSIFDVYIVSLLVGVILGRVGYIISNLDEFMSFIWYWSPYEKYGDTTYIFRLLPWRFLRVWDGGIIIFALFVGFLLFSTFFVSILKRWRWKQIFFNIFFSGVFMLSLSFFFTASITTDLDILLMSVILFLVATFFLIASLVVKRMKIKWKRKRRAIGYIGGVLIWIIGGYLSIKFLLSDVSTVEVVSVYVLDIWIILSTILFVMDMRRRESVIEKVSSVQSVSLPEINQPIRLPLDEKK